MPSASTFSCISCLFHCKGLLKLLSFPLQRKQNTSEFVGVWLDAGTSITWELSGVAARVAMVVAVALEAAVPSVTGGNLLSFFPG